MPAAADPSSAPPPAPPPRAPRGAPGVLGRVLLTVVGWIDSQTGARRHGDTPGRSIDWLGILPMIALHLGCLGVVLVGASPVALAVAGGLYAARMFFVTAFYHRYFSHRAFRTNRFWQLVFAVLGNTCVQRGALWWAGHHRHHHRHADQPGDLHSPRQHGFLYSHMLWIAAPSSMRTRLEAVPDLAKFPELRFLDRFHVLVPLLLAAGLFALGAYLERTAPGLGTNGPQMLVWGFFVSTVVLFHAAVTINSLSHRWGWRRFATRDDSRNNALLALLTFGEGWHNNHHHYPASAWQGFAWWEVDLTGYVLWLLSRIRVVRDLKPVPQRVLTANRVAARPGRA